MLCAYFDETHTHDDSKFVMICGVVASFNVWDAFNDDWRQQLAVPRVSHFHAVDCEQGDGEFAPLSRHLRDSLVWGLADTICKHDIYVVHSVIGRKQWDDPQLKNTRHIFDSPYHLCFTHCLAQLSNWSTHHLNGEPIAAVFSEQNEYQEYAERIYKAYVLQKKRHEEENILVSLQFSPMKLFPGLQAADLVCYEKSKAYLDGITDEKDVTRIGLKRLLAGTPGIIASPYPAAFLAKVMLESQPGRAQ